MAGADMEHDLGHYRLVSDGHCAALVGADASVPWFCAPRFDAAPVLWSLLDPGGASAWIDGAKPATQNGVAAGPVLTTELVAPCGRLEVRDRIDGGRLRRLIRCVDGNLAITHVVRVRPFDRSRSMETVALDLAARRNQSRGVE